MKEAMNTGESVVTGQHLDSHRRRGRRASYCSVCTQRIWRNVIEMTEPAGVPEPRLRWTLCKQCHQVLMQEMDRSPVLSPLRLRIAIGIIAAERWPFAYSTRIRDYISDRRWIVFMAAAFFIAMILHLLIIVMIAFMR